MAHTSVIPAIARPAVGLVMDRAPKHIKKATEAPPRRSAYDAPTILNGQVGAGTQKPAYKLLHVNSVPRNTP